MRNQVSAALADATVGTLETMCFSTVVCEAVPTLAAADVAARVRFTGDDSGTVCVAFSADAARNVTSGFLGLEAQELDETKIRAVVLEIANIICGSMLSACNSGGHFHLDPPVTDPPLEWRADEFCSFELDTGAVRAGVSFAS